MVVQKTPVPPYISLIVVPLPLMAPFIEEWQERERRDILKR